MNKYIFIYLLALAFSFALSGCAGIMDHDHDGIADKFDECPQSPEDSDGFADLDGCPDLDNDLDGVPDSKDKCPNQAEDRDGFEDEDGCPDLDNDKDGIPDLQDKCPFEAEDFDGFNDLDGCPDLDNDQDGVPDSLDKCPMDAEDRDGFEDDDGCPDIDNDHDGIKDSFDKCPDQAEVINGRDDEDGCPDFNADPLPDMLELPLSFVGESAELSPDDKLQLEKQVAPSLIAHPEHRAYVYVFCPMGAMDTTSYLDLLNKRTQSISDFLQGAGVPAVQVRTRTITLELLISQSGTPMDFNATRPILFKRKNSQ